MNVVKERVDGDGGGKSSCDCYFSKQSGPALQRLVQHFASRAISCTVVSALSPQTNVLLSSIKVKVARRL